MRVAPPLPAAAEARRAHPRYALLINPFYAKDPLSSFGKHVLTPSQALTAIAAATPNEWRVRYWDENLLQGPPPSDPFPSLVGITVQLTFARRAYELSDWYRRRGAKVVLGGPHVGSCPDEAAAHADALALGEGVQLWPRMLRDFDAGRLQPRYVGSYRRPYADNPLPRRELIARRDFLTTANLIATRGCRNRCAFCLLSTRGMEMTYQTRDLESVAQEFAASREPYAVFIDNNLGADREYLRALCQRLRSLEKIWSAAVTADLADDPSLVRELALAGCTGVFVGLESVNGENLAAERKQGSRPADYARQVRVFHDHGILVNGSFVFGFDHDRPDVFARTIAWIEEQRLACATFHILTPYPGTPLFGRLVGEGRLLHRDWSRYDTTRAVFRPRHMTPAELEQGYAWCYRKLFSAGSIWRRRPERLGEAPGYLAMSVLYKKLNFLWPWLIRHRLTHAAWQPLVQASRLRHLRFRRRLLDSAPHSPAAHRANAVNPTT
ncbi:B12-binding domain-containing radical SAM protein [Candidatus Sumerlaeota bacterium]